MHGDSGKLEPTYIGGLILYRAGMHWVAHLMAGRQTSTQQATMELHFIEVGLQLLQAGVGQDGTGHFSMGQLNDRRRPRACCQVGILQPSIDIASWGYSSSSQAPQYM